jgi:hypothetical protein
MSEHKHHYTSDDLSLTQAHSYTLLLQVNANSFNYAVISGSELLAWAENYALDELRNPQLLHDILTANYKQVITGLGATGFTLLPHSLFENDRIDDIARLLDVTGSEKVFAEKLDSQNVIIYKTDEILTYAVKELDNQKAVHTDAGFIKAIAKNSPNNTNLYLNIGNDTVSVVNFKEGGLRFYNTFTFKNHEELAYFCALICTELDIKPEDAKLIISGNVNANEKNVSYLQDFFGDVKLNDMQILDLPEGTPPHKILGLAALSLCASSEEN